MEYTIRDINSTDHKEIDLVVRRAMETVLETIPEFAGNPDLALRIWPNFTFDQMEAMFIEGYNHPNHRTLLVIEHQSNQIAGHAICSVKLDDDGVKYGFCYSRFIHPHYRNRGMASALLEEQEKWWKDQGVHYILAQTHETNFKLKQLFEKHGFKSTGPIYGSHYNYYVLKKDL